MTIDHVSLSVGNLQKSRDFYAAALKPIGYEIIHDIADVAALNAGITGCSFGEGKQVRLWLDGDKGAVQTHIAFAAKSTKEVDEFHAAGIASGGTDNGAPGPRANYGPHYYAAFLLDPDQNNIEILYRG